MDQDGVVRLRGRCAADIGSGVSCADYPALGNEPPLMHTSCLSAATSVPYAIDGGACIICIEAGVWNGSEKEVECPPGLEDATRGELGTSTIDVATTGNASADEDSAGDSSEDG
jgi:hypothetical protein